MERIALLGTGLMGYPMAERLLEAGHGVRVYNRTREKAEPLEENGAVVCDSPAEAIAEADCVILILTAADAIRHLLLDSEPRPELKGAHGDSDGNDQSPAEPRRARPGGDA